MLQSSERELIWISGKRMEYLQQGSGRFFAVGLKLSRRGNVCRKESTKKELPVGSVREETVGASAG